MKTKQSSYPFTTEQYQQLNAAQQTAIHAVAEYLTSEPFPMEDLTDELVSEIFNLLKPSKGCVPEEEVDENMTHRIRSKFGAVYQTAADLAVQELAKRGLKPQQDFSICVVIESSFEDTTHIAIVDYNKPLCYVHEWAKAWHFSFGMLSVLADEVLRIQRQIIERASPAVANQEEKTMYVILDGGLVQEVVDVPAGLDVVVLDYDVEDPEDTKLQSSPLDGKPCYLSRF